MKTTSFLTDDSLTYYPSQGTFSSEGEASRRYVSPECPPTHLTPSSLSSMHVHGNRSSSLSSQQLVHWVLGRCELQMCVAGLGLDWATQRSTFPAGDRETQLAGAAARAGPASPTRKSSLLRPCSPQSFIS